MQDRPLLLLFPMVTVMFDGVGHETKKAPNCWAKSSTPPSLPCLAARILQIHPLFNPFFHHVLTCFQNPPVVLKKPPYPFFIIFPLRKNPFHTEASHRVRNMGFCIASPQVACFPPVLRRKRRAWNCPRKVRLNHIR